MTAFAIELIKDIDKLGDGVLNDLRERLKSNNMVLNPFDSELFFNPPHYFIYLRPIFPNLFIVGAFLFIISFLLSNFRLTPFAIPGTLIMLLSCFWTKYFYYFILRIALLKKGFKGRAKLLKNAEGIRILIKKNDGTN